MDDLERFRARLDAVGAELPSEVLPLVHAMFGPLLAAAQALVALDLYDTEPFAPSRLADDGAG